MFAARGSIDPSLGLLGIKAFAAAVIGGFGSLPGALAGGLIVGIAEPFAGRYIAAGYSQIIPYAIMLAGTGAAPQRPVRTGPEQEGLTVRIHQKTSYDDDISLSQDRHQAVWYIAAGRLPLSRCRSCSTATCSAKSTNVLIWAIAGMGLMILAGHTGQPSLGHAAFLACGAYVEAWLNNRGRVVPGRRSRSPACLPASSAR